jgi:hypothetical protein
LLHVNAPETQVNEIKASAFGIQIARSRVAAINSQARAVWAPRSHLIFLIKSGSMYTNATHGEFMKKVSLALLALASALAITPVALADSFYFTFSSSGVNANGTLVGTEIGSTGEYNITGGTIDILNDVFSGPAGNGTFDVGTNPAYGNDDDLYLSGWSSYGTYVDHGGLLFTVDGQFVNLWAGDNNNPGTSYSLSYGDGIFYPGTMSVSPTPEPSSLLLLGSGLLGLAFVAFRKTSASDLI